MLAVCETQVCEDADPMDFHMPGYTFLSVFFPHRGVAIYISNDIVYQYQQHLFTSDAELSAVWVKFKVQAHIAHFCFVYRSPSLAKDSTFNKIDCLSDSISKILESYPDSEIIVAGDFNIHNSNWLHHSSHTSREGLYVELFAENNNLKQLVKEPTYFPNVEGQCQNILDLFMTSDPEKYEVHNLAPLGNSDHMTISASFSYSPTMSASIPAPKRKLWLYAKADWRALNEFFDKFNWNLCFLDKNIDSAAEMVSNIILLGMRLYIPSKNKSIKPKDRSWFNKTCADAVRSKEEAFIEWKSIPTPANELLRKEARNRCNAILKQQQFLHE